MPRQILNITSIEEIKRVQDAILNNEDFEFGEIKPITYMLKLDGGRFAENHASIIDADIAKIIVSHQENYTKLLNELERNFEIEFSDEARVLKFKLQDGCLELISELLGLEGLKNMESKHLMYVILGIAAMWFSYSSYTYNVDAELQKVKTHSEVKIKEMEIAEKQSATQAEKEDRQRERETYQDIVNKILEKDNEIKLNKNLQDAINKPKQVTVSVLKDNEKVKIDNQTLTKANEPLYEYVTPSVDDIEEAPIEGIYTLEYYNFVKDGKMFKIVGISPLANSETISADKRMRLMTKAETQQQVKLKIKIVKDGITKKPIKAFILDYIEN